MADKGDVISGATLDRLTPEQLDELGVQAKRARRAVFAHRHSGVPADMAMYRLETRRQLPAVDTVSDEPPRA